MGEDKKQRNTVVAAPIGIESIAGLDTSNRWVDKMFFFGFCLGVSLNYGWRLSSRGRGKYRVPCG